MIRQIISVAACCAILSAAGDIGAQVKLDPYFDISSHANSLKSISLDGDASSSSDVHVFIKSSDTQKTRESIIAAGGKVHMTVGGIITASVDLSSLKAIAKNEDVVFIEAEKPVYLKNDVAGNEINSTDVHAGAELSQAFTGRGVIVGLIDTGIDYRHTDFLDAEGRSRILAIWDQNRSGGPAPAEISDSYGTECDTESIAAGSCPIRDYEGHGTHVAGILAARHETYGGVAPDANIVAVTYDSSLDLGSGYANTIFSTKICQAAYYVFAKAQSLGMPAVVNLSLGTHLGAHDGSSLFEECLAGLVRDSAGRAIVAAAGNERSSDETYTGIHAGFEVNGTAATNFVIRQATRDRIYYIDFWAAPGANLSVGLAIRQAYASGEPLQYSGLVAAGERKEGSFVNGSIGYTINSTETQSALNGKQHVGITITLGSSVTQPSNYSFDLVVEGRGAFDAWLFPDKPSRTIQFTSISGDRGAGWSYVAGDRIKSVAIPSTSPDIISVGAYTSRNQWDSGSGCCQVTYELGNLLDFSSSGPSASANATGTKPNLTAPGGMIASSLSNDTIPNSLLVVGEGKHMLQAGTSMAAPFVSGAIALMFEANPNFTHSDVLRYLSEGAYSDEAVGDVPNDRWGLGKLDVLKAVELAIAGGASGSFDASRDTSAVEPNDPAQGSSGSGCSFVANQKINSNSTTGIVIIFMPTIAAIFLKRRLVHL